MTNWKIGETYKTRGGRDARVLTIHERQRLPLIGEYQGKDGIWCPMSWTSKGTYFEVVLTDFDLIPPEPKRETVKCEIFWMDEKKTVEALFVTLHLEDGKPVDVELYDGKGAHGGE